VKQHILNLLKNPFLDINQGVTSSHLRPIDFIIQSGDLELIDLLMTHPYLEIPQNNYDYNPLLRLACKQGHTPLVARFLQQEIPLDINQQDNNGFTALHLAILKNSLEIVELLLQDPSIDQNLPTQDGFVPYILAEETPNIDIRIAGMILAHRDTIEFKPSINPETSTEAVATAFVAQFLA
jgi:hypothetical protein